MVKQIVSILKDLYPVDEASAHCDGPCGVYDPASARIAAEAVLSMTKKILALQAPDMGDPKAMVANLNTISRFIQIKEEQAHLAKEELLVLWTDYFKPAHLDKYPDLHDVFWKAAKLCSACKHEVNLDRANELMQSIEKVHRIFWETKGRQVTYYTAS